MSSPFLLSGGGLTLAQLQDGSTPINVASVAVSGLVPNLPVCTNGSRRLLSRLIGLADLNFAPTTSPFPGSFQAVDFVTAYNTIPRSVNSLVTEVDAFTGSNVGVGSGQVFRSRAGTPLAPLLEFRTIQGSADGISVATGLDTVGISCDIAGATPSATPGAGLYIGKSGAALNFRRLVAGSGIAVTEGAPTALDVQIDDALTASNLGAGSQVFSARVGADLRFRSLVAGTGLAITQDANTVTVATSPPTAVGLATQTSAVAPLGQRETWILTGGVVAGNSCLTSLYPTADRWVASGTSLGFRLSTDGLTTLATTGVSTGLAATAWAPQLNLLSARNYTVAPAAYLSVDQGSTWVAGAPVATLCRLSSYPLAWSGVNFVAAVQNANSVETSPDGVTWTPRATPNIATQVLSLGGGALVTVSYTAGSLYSADHGVTWLAAGGTAGATPLDLPVYAPELGLLLASAVTPGDFAVSYDLGATWSTLAGFNPAAVRFRGGVWANGRLTFYGGAADGVAQGWSVEGLTPLDKLTGGYLLPTQTTLNLGGTEIYAVGYDVPRGRYVTSCNLAGSTRYTNGDSSVVAVSPSALPADVQGAAVYMQARAAPADSLLRCSTYYRSADTNMATRILGVERPLSGPSVKISRRFDGNLAGQTFWASDAGGISFGWDQVNKQLRFTTTAADFYGSTTMISSIVLNTTTILPADTYTSAVLAAATVYYAANVATARVATWDMVSGGPFWATIVLAAATLSTATIPMYTIRLMMTANGALGNISIEREFTY